jgi:hypothetical protein
MTVHEDVWYVLLDHFEDWETHGDVWDEVPGKVERLSATVSSRSGEVIQSNERPVELCSLTHPLHLM